MKSERRSDGRREERRATASREEDDGERLPTCRYSAMHSRRKVLTRAHPCTYSSNALLKKARCEGGEGRTRGLTRRTPRGGRVCARLCVDRGVNKRYTNVSHLGVYPPPLLSPYPPSSLSLTFFLPPSVPCLPPLSLSLARAGHAVPVGGLVSSTSFFVAMAVASESAK